jgi:putative DNA primase/helicase
MEGTKTEGRGNTGTLAALHRIELIAVRPQDPVWVADSNEAADALIAHGALATACGDNPVEATDWSPLANRQVRIWPQLSRLGFARGYFIQDFLLAMGARVDVLDTMQLKPIQKDGGAAEWFADHPDATAADVWRLATEEMAGAEPTVTATDPRPRDLPQTLKPVPRWESDLLPRGLQPWVCDVSERMQAPPEFAAVSALVALGAVIGRQLAVLPKRLDTWSVIAHPWGAVVGRPGVLKSPALREGIRLLQELEADAALEHKSAAVRHETKKQMAQARIDALKVALRAATQKDDTAELARIERELNAALIPVEEPQPKRYVSNDATVEKLGEILAGNPNGTLIFRDELAGWLGNLDHEGREGERAFYLEAWDGQGAFTFDRIGRGTVRIDPLCLTMLGGIQPGPLTEYLLAAARGGRTDDGLLQRFQLLVYPDVPEKWCNVDRPPDAAICARTEELFRTCARLKPLEVGATHRAGKLPAIHFDEDAQALHDSWRPSLEERLRTGDEPPMFAAHLGKYRSLIPALAALFHIADVASGFARPGPISAGAFRLALRWAEFLEAHAARVYALGEKPADAAARALAAKLKAGALPESFTARQIERHHWAGLAHPDEVREGIETLAGLGWLQVDVHSGRGRPVMRYRLNPRVKKEARAHRG